MRRTRTDSPKCELSPRGRGGGGGGGDGCERGAAGEPTSRGTDRKYTVNLPRGEYPYYMSEKVLEKRGGWRDFLLDLTHVFKLQVLRQTV